VAHSAGTKGEERRATFFVRFSCIKMQEHNYQDPIVVGISENAARHGHSVGSETARADDTSSFMHVVGGRVPSHKGKTATIPRQQAFVG
jgi:hypothetical protein